MAGLAKKFGNWFERDPARNGFKVCAASAILSGTLALVFALNSLSDDLDRVANKSDDMSERLDRIEPALRIGN